MFGRSCERYEQELESLNKSPEFSAVFEEHRQIIEYVSTHSGVNMTKDNIMSAFTRFSNVYDILLNEVGFALDHVLYCKQFISTPQGGGGFNSASVSLHLVQFSA